LKFGFRVACPKIQSTGFIDIDGIVNQEVVSRDKTVFDSLVTDRQKWKTQPAAEYWFSIGGVPAINVSCSADLISRTGHTTSR
jgi:hypothetical protein